MTFNSQTGMTFKNDNKNQNKVNDQKSYSREIRSKLPQMGTTKVNESAIEKPMKGTGEPLWLPPI